MTIRVYATGGTFDKEYNELTGELYFQDSHVRDMLRKGRCNLQLEIRTLMLIDSTQMSEIDREIIAKSCKECGREQIVITHGTDSIVDTARFLAERIEGKVIVLVGAMIPYTFGSSDGLFNLGSALAFVQVLPPGIYVTMNGRCFDWDNVRKNRAIGMFEKLREE